MRIAGIISESYVDGPGIRLVIFAQGCSRHCAQCQNPHTWDYSGGYEIAVDDIFNKIEADPLIDGVSFSGGECFDQPEAFGELAKVIKDRYGFKIWAWSGYLFEELEADSKKFEMLKNIDYLADGRFEVDKKSPALKWRGSSNQRLIDVQESLKTGKVVEVEDIE